ncbi:MAG TPA: acetylxylan esterase [Candidatus Hydrogenedentes bacterium]|nr:acetylxylan esterase [Candidatus Hydrogenedentota bacterium]
MRHKLFYPFFAILLAAFSIGAEKPYTLNVVTDRQDALYHVNETVSFVISLQQDKETVTAGEVAYVLTNDGEDEIAKGTLPLSADSARVTGTLDKPGFLRCEAQFITPDGKKVSALGGAGIDPLLIKPSLPPPDDFDAFWEGKKAALAEVPMNARLTPVATSTENIECFDLQLDCLGGAPVSGYFARPKGATAKSLPALLTVHGAGVRSANKPERYAARGLLALDINAHGIPNGQSEAYYDELAAGRLKDYRYQGRENRETYYFLGMYLRLIRAMAFLTAQPEWNGTELIVCGSSQGGGQAIVAAGLDTRVTAFAANVPAMCDHTGRVNGWPRLVPHDDTGKPDPQITETARYFDAMNFATRTKADAVVSVGFIDNTCRPTTVYAAYNNLQGKKRIINEPRMTHTTWPSFTKAQDALIAAHLPVTATTPDVVHVSGVWNGTPPSNCPAWKGLAEQARHIASTVFGCEHQKI